MARPGRHRTPRAQLPRILPEWVKGETNPCLVSNAEDAYMARHLAEEYGATGKASCAELLKAGEKSLKRMANTRLGDKERCDAGERAARKFWEAKTCARR